MAGDFDYIIKQGDTNPTFSDTLTYSDGTAVDLTSASVKFVMRGQPATVATTNATATIGSPATSGKVSYQPVATDTATPGRYMGNWVVTFTGGSIMTFPTDGYLSIIVEENLTTPGSVQLLVSVADAKDYLNIPATDRTRDAKLLTFIEGVRPLIEAITGPIIPTAYDEWYDGGQVFITLRHRPHVGYGTSPLLTVQAISEYNGPIEWPLSIISSPDQGQLYSAQVDVWLGRIVRRTAGGGVQAFPSMPQSVHVVYTSGQNIVPWNVQEATKEYLREQFQDTQQGQGLRNQASIMDDEIAQHAFIGFALSGRVTQMLAPTRRAPSLA
jgi:hypothetical protein